MADRLTDFDFDADPPKRLSPYPIDLWMDGGIWRIWQGEDFHGEVRSMRSRLHHYASAAQLSVRTRQVFDGDRVALVFQFTPRNFTHQLR